MTIFIPEICEQITDTILSNLAAVSESLKSALDLEGELSAGEKLTGGSTACEKAVDQPGLMITIGFEEQGLVCLIPESLPLPDWYRKPDASQDSKLQTIPVELAALLPKECEATAFAAVACENIREQIKACEPAEDATIVEIQVGEPSDESEMTSLLCVWPVAKPLLDVVEPQPIVEADSESVESHNGEVATSDSPASETVRRIQRVRSIPVLLTVRIADKKVDLRQLRAVGPGTLLTFDKSCDALLDVLVADRLKFRGEAVKVGENFGIKINETNSTVVREPRVHRV